MSSATKRLFRISAVFLCIESTVAPLPNNNGLSALHQGADVLKLKLSEGHTGRVKQVYLLTGVITNIIVLISQRSAGKGISSTREAV